jgi:hypothetical protein
MRPDAHGASHVEVAEERRRKRSSLACVLLRRSRSALGGRHLRLQRRVVELEADDTAAGLITRSDVAMYQEKNSRRTG